MPTRAMTVTEDGEPLYAAIKDVYLDYYLAVAMGKVPNARLFGSNGKKVTTGADSGLIWPNGAFDIPPQPAGLSQMEIVSDNAADTTGGTGIRSVHIHYMNIDGDLAVQEEALTGTTPKTITFTGGIRFAECMHLATFGSGKKAAGNITLRATGAGQTYSYIAQNGTRCTSSARMVPAGYTAFVLGATGGSVSATGAETEIIISSSQIETYKFVDPLILHSFGSLVFQDNSFGLSFPVPMPFDEGQVMGMEFSTDKASTITGQWFGFIEKL